MSFWELLLITLDSFPLIYSESSSINPFYINISLFDLGEIKLLSF